MPTPKITGKRGIHPPAKGGWESNSVYLVDVAWDEQNIIYRAILYVAHIYDEHDHLELRHPCNWVAKDPETARPQDAVYLKAVKKLAGEQELKYQS